MSFLSRESSFLKKTSNPLSFKIFQLFSPISNLLSSGVEKFCAMMSLEIKMQYKKTLWTLFIILFKF